MTTPYKSDLGRVVQTGNFLLLDHHTTKYSKYIHITKTGYTVDSELREQEIHQCAMDQTHESACEFMQKQPNPQ